MKTNISQDSQPAEQVGRTPSDPQPFRLVTVRGQPRPGVDLDCPRAIEIIEDEVQFGSQPT